MTFRRVHRGDETSPSLGQSLRERALAAYQEKSTGPPIHDLQFSTEEGQRAIHELKVHQIELEMQNEELRQSQQALEESRQRYLDLYDLAPVGYCIVGPKGLIQESNRTLAEMLGTYASRLQKERFSRFIFEDDQNIFYLLRKRILESTEPQTCELRVQRSDETLGWVQLWASIATGKMDTASLRVVVLDIDARIRAETAKASLESQLRESQKMEAMGTLAGGIAHDFNNILAVILSNTELARQLSKQTDSAASHCVDEIQKAGERARDLVKQLLAFCRRQPTDRKPIALAPVIEDSIRLLRSTIPARVNLSFTCAEQVPNVLADLTQIEQVVINLATNAVQAMDGKAGSIKIHLDTVERPSVAGSAGSKTQSVQCHTKLVRLTFSDDGPGIEPAILERIFEPFFTTKAVDEGTGLGLAVVHGIIRAHDAEIFAESQVGHGATFTIYFPPANLAEIESSGAHVLEPVNLENHATTATLASPLTPTCRMLYIDDDEMVLQSIVNLLAHHGIQVCGYSDQRTALVALRAAPNSFDVVVTDYNMPGLSGLEVAKLVREIRPDLPVVVTSGFIDGELHSHADEAGVSALVPKPFAAKQLCDLVKKLIHR